MTTESDKAIAGWMCKGCGASYSANAKPAICGKCNGSQFFPIAAASHHPPEVEVGDDQDDDDDELMADGTRKSLSKSAAGMVRTGVSPNARHDKPQARLSEPPPAGAIGPQNSGGRTMAGQCRMGGCDRPAYSRGLCKKHCGWLSVRATPEKRTTAQAVALPATRTNRFTAGPGRTPLASAAPAKRVAKTPAKPSRPNLATRSVAMDVAAGLSVDAIRKLLALVEQRDAINDQIADVLGAGLVVSV